MDNPFFEGPVLNSPYEHPKRHWEVDKTGQPTQKIIKLPLIDNCQVNTLTAQSVTRETVVCDHRCLS